jgi:murein L,D-transpeptidase YafK
MMRFLILFLLPNLFSLGAAAQYSFVDEQKASYRMANVFNSKEEQLRKEFEQKGLEWPAKYIYIRSFKYDAQLEIWVKNNIKDKYKLFKTYKVCMQSGTMGPKRLQGDYQVPEGFYYINEFKSNSAYHLSLGLNYPNASDRILSDSFRPGSAIYIHGSCVSVGCIPVTDNEIEEIYILGSYARASGVDFIPVHVFPFRYSNRRSMEYFNVAAKDNEALQKFASQLREAYDKFEETKQLPLIMIDRNGQYVIN